MEKGRYLSAREAAGELEVSLSTLYAYVSRGLVRSEAAGGRRRRYRAEDVRRLKERAEQRRGNPVGVAEGALSWGTPVMESGITLITDDGLYYRGRDVLGIARGGSAIEEVAALIWTGDEAAPEIFSGDPPVYSGRFEAVRRSVAGLAPVEAFQVLLPLAAVEDLAAYDLRPGAVARTGARILRLMAAIAVGEAVVAGSVAGTLQKGWVPQAPEAAALLNAALVLCADHELTVSSFAARCVASAEAAPYAVVAAGLAAMQGAKHGGQIELVEAFLSEAGAPDGARQAVADRLRRGENRVPGFGHSLYPDGDPRGAELLGVAAAARPGSPHVALASAVAAAVLDLLGERPTVDFGLVTLARALALPPGAAKALFAVGRTVGWIGHALEQYQTDSLIRPRARYVGIQPVS